MNLCDVFFFAHRILVVTLTQDVRITTLCIFSQRANFVIRRIKIIITSETVVLQKLVNVLRGSMRVFKMWHKVNSFVNTVKNCHDTVIGLKHNRFFTLVNVTCTSLDHYITVRNCHNFGFRATQLTNTTSPQLHNSTLSLDFPESIGLYLHCATVAQCKLARLVSAYNYLSRKIRKNFSQK